LKVYHIATNQLIPTILLYILVVLYTGAQSIKALLKS